MGCSGRCRFSRSTAVHIIILITSKRTRVYREKFVLIVACCSGCQVLMARQIIIIKTDGGDVWERYILLGGCMDNVWINCGYRKRVVVVQYVQKTRLPRDGKDAAFQYRYLSENKTKNSRACVGFGERTMSFVRWTRNGWKFTGCLWFKGTRLSCVR